MEPGRVIGGKYRVEGTLGRGGMGQVYVAVQEPLGRKVALKVIHGARTSDDDRARFEREAQVVAQLNCPHVVTVYDFGEHEGEPFIAMQLLEGETLRAHIERGPVPLAHALSWVRDIACARRRAPDVGVVHRAGKPEHLRLVPPPARGRSAQHHDFGRAELCAKDRITGATPLGTVTGTPGYIAPEHVLEGQADSPSIDIYALGVVLYELVTGAPPYSAPTAMALMMAHVRDPLPDPVLVNPRLPPEVAALARRLLAKDAASRPADGSALVTAIDQVRARCGVVAASAVTLDAAGVPASALAQPAKPSIAVQPFQAIGGEDDRIFAEGISEDILTALSCFKQLFVVAVTSMIQPAGRDSDALRVGQSLGVRYVLQGSVRRGGDRIRINAKLVDVASGGQVWAQRYDRRLDDLFAVQDEVTRAIVACVAGHVEQAQAEIARRKPPQALAAYEWLARGRAHHHKRTVEDNRQARAALDRALELDPDYAQAHAWRACVVGQALALGDDVTPFFPIGMGSLQRALELDESDAECQRILAEVQMLSDIDRAWQTHERAIELNPNDARIVGQRGELCLYRGELAEAAEALELAARLDPLNPKPFFRHLACVRYMLRELDEAARVVGRCDETRQDVLALGAAIAALRGDDATLGRYRERLRAASSKPFVLGLKPFATDELQARWREGFERAGLA